VCILGGKNRLVKWAVMKTSFSLLSDELGTGNIISLILHIRITRAKLKLFT
jgi:hypothetical protein